MNQTDHGQNNFKDTHLDSKNTSLSLKDRHIDLSYKKTNKLITALYMVTDILDTTEPIRFKLRTLGVEILSDTRTKLNHQLTQKVQEVLYLLDIAITMNMLSEMNSNILKKEFSELKKAVEEYNINTNLFGGKASLSEFLDEDVSLEVNSFDSYDGLNNKDNYFQRQASPTRIGVQKGSTLMKALSDRMVSRPISLNTRPLESSLSPIDMSVKKKSRFDVFSEQNFQHQKTNLSILNKKKEENQDFDLLKKQRRFEIVQIIKDKVYEQDGASITDIKTVGGEALSLCSEKTLQRELVAMVSDGVLKKVGSKRWSRYFLLN